MFMGMCYGETPYKIAKNYLLISPQNLYMHRELNDPRYFLTDEWLRDLDDEPVVSGNLIYRNEIKGFLEIIDGLTNVLLKWKTDEEVE